MKKFKKSENCHRCTINYVLDKTRCSYCNLALCLPCYWYYPEFDEKYKLQFKRFLPCGSMEVACYNCKENELVMKKIDCWLAVHGTNKNN